MENIIKDKNYLVFTNKDNRTYKFDINTSIFYSTKGVSMKTTPNGFTNYIAFNRKSNVLEYLYKKHYYSGASYSEMSKYANNIIVCDKLDSIGYEIKNNYDFADDKIEFIGKYFKQFAKAFQEDEKLSIEDFINTYGKRLYLETLGLKEDNYYTEEILDKVWEWKNIFSNKEMIYIAYYLSRGVYDFFDDNGYYGITYPIFENFFKWSEQIEYTPTKDDFFKQYIMVKKNYKIYKKGFDNKAITEQLDKHKNIWEFENDDFMIVVPNSCEDFQEEAKQQDNCVYSTYLQQVVRGDTNIVFIRKKSNPKKSFITCEVSNGGYIRQYLLKHNYNIDTDTAEYEFKKAFEKYIDENWD